MSNPLTPEQVQALLEQCDIVALDWPQLHERNLTVPVGVPTLRALLTLADAYDSQARELAEVKAERDALKAKVEQVVQRWRREASEYPASETGAAYAQAAVRLCANELAAILKGEQ